MFERDSNTFSQTNSIQTSLSAIREVFVSGDASVVALGEYSSFDIYERSNDSYSLALNYEVNETVN